MLIDQCITSHCICNCNVNNSAIVGTNLNSFFYQVFMVNFMTKYYILQITKTTFKTIQHLPFPLFDIFKVFLHKE